MPVTPRRQPGYTLAGPRSFCLLAWGGKAGALSIQAVSWAFAQRGIAGSLKLVLVRLAESANPDGICWPSQQQIADDCGIGRPHVSDRLKALAAAGLIAIEGGGNRRSYRLSVAQEYTCQCSPEEHSVSPMGTPVYAETTLSVAQEDTNLKEPSSNRNKPSNARDDEFAEWWKGYPHKVGKPAAKLKFSIARRSASQADLLAGVQRYVSTKPADRPWCNPATWLHQERWTDEPAEVAERINGRQPAELPGNTSLGTADDSVWRRRLEHYAKSKFWNENWGFKPDDPDCYAPVALLSEYGFLRSEQHA